MLFKRRTYQVSLYGVKSLLLVGSREEGSAVPPLDTVDRDGRLDEGRLAGGGGELPGEDGEVPGGHDYLWLRFCKIKYLKRPETCDTPMLTSHTTIVILSQSTFKVERQFFI